MPPVKNQTPNAPFTKLIFEIADELGPLFKSEKNPHHGYSYVPIDTYYEKVARTAMKRGLCWNIFDLKAEVSDGHNRKADDFMMITYGFSLFLKSGEIWSNYDTVTIFHPLQGGPTAGSARSYAEKQFMRSLFKIVTGEKDLDADHQQPRAKDFIGDVIDNITDSTIDKTTEELDDGVAMGTISLTGNPPEDAREQHAQAQAPVEVSEEPLTTEPSTESVEPPPPDIPPSITDILKEPVKFPTDASFKESDLQKISTEMVMGLPIINPETKKDKWLLVSDVFLTFVDQVNDYKALVAWWRENTPALDALKNSKVASEDGVPLYDVVKGYFTSRRDEIELLKQIENTTGA